MKILNRLLNISLMMIASQAVWAEDSKLTFSTGVDYSSGKYGQSEKTEVIYIPFVVKYELKDYTFKLTVPWLDAIGPGTITAGDRSVQISNTSLRKTRESGWGDISANVVYSAYASENGKFLIDLGAKVKLGTASYSKSLGTGEKDYSAYADFYKTFNQLTLMSTVGYRFVGDPAGINLNDVWYGNLGAAYKIDKKNTLGLSVDMREAVSQQGSELREYSVFYVHRFNERYKLQNYLYVGDTRSSADFGGGVMLGVSM